MQPMAVDALGSDRGAALGVPLESNGVVQVEAGVSGTWGKVQVVIGWGIAGLVHPETPDARDLEVLGRLHRATSLHLLLGLSFSLLSFYYLHLNADAGTQRCPWPKCLGSRSQERSPYRSAHSALRPLCTASLRPTLSRPRKSP